MNMLVRTGIGPALMMTWLAGAAPAHSQPASTQAVLTLPATGTFARGGEFRGTISINRFERRGNDIVAIGLVSGVLSRGANAIGTAVAGEVAWPVRVSSGGVAVVNARTAAPGGVRVMKAAWSPRLLPAQAQTCPVLNIALGPTSVDLLGLQVALSGVTLDLTGVTGTALGDLVCSVSDLLGNVAGLVNLLNSVLGLVTGLLGGLTGGLIGGAPIQ